MFGDTLFSTTSVDGTHLRTNTAALADVNNPYEVSEPVDANGAPYQFIPFSSAQQTYNDNATNKSHDRYIIWPDRAINIDADNAYVFYKNIKATPTTGNNYTLTGLGTGVARVGANSTTATRVMDTLFTADEDKYVPEMIHGDYIYAFHCVNGFLVGDCAVARTLKSNILIRASYQFWDNDNSVWQDDINQATHHIVGSTSSMSVIYSQYLKKYLMLGAGAFSHELYMRTADNPEGPWSDREIFYDDGDQIYGGRIHEELSTNGGQTIPLTLSSTSGMKIVSLNFDTSNKGAGEFTLTGRDAYLTDPVDPEQDPPQSGGDGNEENDGQTPNLNTPNSDDYPLSPKTGAVLGSVIVVASLAALGVSVYNETKKQKQKIKASEK